MRIALVILTGFPGGSAPARRIHMIGKGLVRLGHEVHVVVAQRFGAGPLEADIDGIRVHWGTITTADKWNRPGARLAGRRSVQRLISQLARQGLDWILLSNPTLDAVSQLLTVRRCGGRVVAMYDDLRADRRQPTWEDRLRLLWLRSADQLIPRLTHLNLAISTYLEQRINAMAPSTPTLLLPPIVDLSLFACREDQAAAFRSQYGLDGHNVIGYMGTFWQVDGIRVLLEAARVLAAEGESFRLAISGTAHEGLDCDDVPALVGEFALNDLVKQTGWLPLEEVTAAMVAADILVVPKLDHIANRAGMPTKLAEYLAAGRPIVASNVGDIPLYLVDGENALLCAPNDPQALAQAIRRLLHDPALQSAFER